MLLLLGFLAVRACGRRSPTPLPPTGRAAIRRPASTPAWLAAGAIAVSLAGAQVAAVRRPERPNDATAMTWPENPFIGAWGLMVAQSTYLPTPQTLRTVLVCETLSDKLILTWDVTYQGGRVERRGYAVALNGTEHFISSEGLPYRSVTLTRINEYIVDVVVRENMGGPVRLRGTVVGSMYNKSFVVTLQDSGAPRAARRRFVFEKY
jgi:hypothetical protein